MSMGTVCMHAGRETTCLGKVTDTFGFHLPGKGDRHFWVPTLLGSTGQSQGFTQITPIKTQDADQEADERQDGFH